MPDPLSLPPSSASERWLVTRKLVDTRIGQVHIRLSRPLRNAKTTSPVRLSRGSAHTPAARSSGGSAHTPLVMLHMTPLSSSMYEPLVPRLGTERLVVAPDRPGFGFSDVPPRQLTMAEYAQVTLDVLDALGIDRFDVLGTHTGSVEATELAWANPARVRKVVLVAVPVYTPDELEERRYRFAGVLPPTEDGSHLRWHWQRRFLYRQPPYDLPLFQWRLLQELLAGEHVWWPYKAVFEYPMAERLAGLRQPVLVLAPRDDLWEQTERVYRSGGLPALAQFVELPHLGLDIAYYAPDEIARLMRNFLDSD